jgi:cephalosporin-C deacetylase-like acetyl esterase
MLVRYLKAHGFFLLDERRKTIEQIRTLADIDKRRQRFRERIWDYLGGQPERTPLNAKVTGTLDRRDHRIEKIIFESRPGFYVTANLYVPAAGTPPYPAILYPLGHESGAKAHSAWQRCLVNLTRRGFVCLTWDPLGQGERVQFYDEDWHDSKLSGSTVEHTILGMQCHLLGTHIAQFTIWDGIRALDYLTSRPEVDRERIGCTGNSGGGTHTAYLSALDDRIKVAAPSCYITSWWRLLESIGPQDAEQVFPLFLKDEFDFPDYLYALGPKPYLILSAMRDFFPIGGARASYQEAKQVFARAGAPGHVDMFEADDGHGYTKPRREAAYRWFTRWLQGKENPDPESPVELVPAEQLNCTPTGQVKLSYPSGADVHSVIAEIAGRLRSRRTPTEASVRERAREVTGFAGKSSPPALARFGEVARPGCRVEKLAYESEPGISIPALLFVGNTGGATRPAVLIADADGKHATVAEAEELAAAGFIVLAPDLRGFGETKPNIDRDYFSRNFGDYEHATTALLIGKTMPGMRALDAICGIDVLAARNDVDGNRMGVVGRGSAALAVLFAAIFDERISRIVLDRMLASYDLVVNERIHQGLADQIVPSALKYFDLPDVVASLAPRRVAAFNCVNQLGQELPEDRLRREYARALERYAEAGAASALRIGVRNRDETTFVPIVKSLFEA